MNTKESQTAFETMVQQSLTLRLCELGASEPNVHEALAGLDFNDIRGFLPHSNDELKAAFSHLFA